jgi:predicted RNA-binding protein with EMAP domain
MVNLIERQLNSAVEELQSIKMVMFMKDSGRMEDKMDLVELFTGTVMSTKAYTIMGYLTIMVS